MNEIARQSTARNFIVGPILDADGVAVTDAVIGDLKLSKNGAAPAALNGSATLTHRHTGMYSLGGTAGDVDTVGSAVVTIDDTTNAMQPFRITVVEAAIYDALFAASSVFGRALQCIGSGTVDTGATATTIPLKTLNITLADADQLAGRVLIFPSTEGTGRALQACVIQSVSLSPDVLTVTQLTRAPSEDDVFIIQ